MLQVLCLFQIRSLLFDVMLEHFDGFVPSTYEFNPFKTKVSVLCNNSVLTAHTLPWLYKTNFLIL